MLSTHADITSPPIRNTGHPFRQGNQRSDMAANRGTFSESNGGYDGPERQSIFLQKRAHAGKEVHIFFLAGGGIHELIVIHKLIETVGDFHDER